MIHAQCSFTATYFLHNPTTGVEEVLGAFYTVERVRNASRSETPYHVDITLEGQRVTAEATPEQLARMDEIVKQDRDIAQELGNENLELAREPFRIVVEAGARARLVFHGELNPTDFDDSRPAHGYPIPANVVRHPFLSRTDSETWTKSGESYLYLISPLGNWAGDPEVFVTVRHHRANDFTPSSPEGFRSTTDGKITTARTVVRASAKKNLRFRLEYDPFPILNGGPLVGIGPRIAREELRLRAGYEVSGPEYLIYGVAAESNLDTYFTAVATIEAATPNFLILFPSLAVGLGVPVQVRKSEPTRVGVRGELTFSFPILSLVFPVDYFPVANSSGSHWEGAFVTQLSF